MNFLLSLQELQDDIQDHLHNLEYINHTGQELLQKTSPGEKVEKLTRDLAQLNTRWTDISTVIDNRVSQLENTIAQIKQYKVTPSFGVEWNWS